MGFGKRTPRSSWVLALVLIFWIGMSVFARAEDATLARLKEVQQAVYTVVSSAMPSVVAISDGTGFGSGVIVDESGLILTAGHVVNTGVREFDVFLPSGRTTKARLLGYNLNVDIGMIQISEPGTWPAVAIGNQSDQKLGDWAVCLGHSGGYELGRKPPVRTGRILEFRDDIVVTDAVLIGGDSGGPLFDLNGKLIAIHSSIGEVISENRHVSIDIFRRDWDRLKAGERWGKLPSLPGDIDDPPQNENSQRAKLGLAVDRSVDRALVTEVHPGSPANRVGIKVGDVIEQIDGQNVRDGNHLIEIIKAKKIGASAKLKVRRGQSRFDLEVILDKF
jgi:serine protease Do